MCVCVFTDRLFISRDVCALMQLSNKRDMALGTAAIAWSTTAKRCVCVCVGETGVWEGMMRVNGGDLF